MIYLTNTQLAQIEGGAISGTLINALVRGINSILDLGRSLGSAIRRIVGNNVCPL